MIRQNIIDVKNRIEQACARCSRDVSEITLISVSKTKPIEMIKEAYGAGMLEFGENRPQELRDKAKQLLDTNIHWHMIGTLQTNKIKYVVGTACLIHSVDSMDLAKAIEKEAQKKSVQVNILLEVNIAKETSKHGFLEQNRKNLELLLCLNMFVYVKHLEC